VSYKPVFRGDGVQLFGFDAEVELKKQAKRDSKWEQELLTFIEESTSIKVHFILTVSSH
jgi:hypothetical protein